MRERLTVRVKKYGGGYTNISISPDIYHILCATFEHDFDYLRDEQQRKKRCEKACRQWLSKRAETIPSGNLSQKVRSLVLRRIVKPELQLIAQNYPILQSA